MGVSDISYDVLIESICFDGYMGVGLIIVSDLYDK